MALPNLLIATRNPGKVREYRELLRDVPYRLVSLDDEGVTQEVEETGHTFEENAQLKACRYAILSGLLTLADDSGIEVDALGGEPGIYSARYGEELCNNPTEEVPKRRLSDQDRVELLLRNLKDVPWERRTARFRCVIAIAAPVAARQGNPDVELVAGSVEGMIQYTSLGQGGFGYDPVFYLPSHGVTMAQIPIEEKNRISHRAIAARKAGALLKRLAGIQTSGTGDQ